MKVTDEQTVFLVFPATLEDKSDQARKTERAAGTIKTRPPPEKEEGKCERLKSDDATWPLCLEKTELTLGPLGRRSERKQPEDEVSDDAGDNLLGRRSDEEA